MSITQDIKQFNYLTSTFQIMLALNFLKMLF